MRVIGTKPSTTLVMGKKKHKLRKGKSHDYGSDSSDEGATAVTRCSHLSKAINQNNVKKTLKRVDRVGECTDCVEGSHKSDDHHHSKTSVGVEDEDGLMEGGEPTVWLCLQCGHQGCDRNSKAKHALHHYQTPRSACHAVVVNLNTWLVWCYACDEEVSPSGSGKLQESMEYLRKQMGTSSRPDSGTSTAAGKRSEPVRAEGEDGPGDVDNQDPHKRALKSGGGQLVQRTGSLTGLSLPKVKGLSNLGNTCFFNAVMQNLSQTPILESLLREHGKKGMEMTVSGCQPVIPDTSEEDSDSTSSSSATEDDWGHGSKKTLQLEPLTVVLPEAGVLTQSVMSFLRDMGSATKNTTICPTSLFGQVCRKAPTFKGYQQQDSHELLRHLLDGMKAEEIKRSQSAILKNFHMPENVHPKNVGGDLKAKLKEYGRHVKHTFVDSVFGGHFISTVLCEECRVPSQILEPFLDISLPITEQKVLRPTHLWTGGKKLEQKKSDDLNSALDDLLGVTKVDQPSKYALKKSKRQSKKESKRKNRQRKVSSSNKGGGDDHPEGTAEAPAAEGGVEEAEDEEEEEEEEDGEQEEDGAETSDSTKANVDSRSPSDYDISDADVEDNLENDLSRNKFQALESEPSPPTSPTACDNDCSLVCDAPSVDANSLGNGSEAERTSISSATDSTVTLTEDNVLDEQRTRSAENIPDITHQMETLHLEGSSSRNGAESPRNDVPRRGDCIGNGGVPKPSKAGQRHRLKVLAMQTMGVRYEPASRECSVQSCLSQFTAPELLTGNNKFGCDNCSRRTFIKQGKQGKREVQYRNASKQVLIFSPPAVLTLHLKRFQQVGFRIRKINHHVDFPMVLDLAPNCTTLSQGVKSGQTKVLYSLYGVVEHTGQMSAGHYTAYVKVRPVNCVSKIQAFLSNAETNNGLKLDRLLEAIQSLREHSQGGATGGGATGDEESVATPPAGKWYYISDSRVSEVVNESNILRCQAYLLFYERIY